MKWTKLENVTPEYKLRVDNKDFSVYTTDLADTVEFGGQMYINVKACMVRHTRRATMRHAKCALKKFYIDGLKQTIHILQQKEIQ